MNLPYSWLIYTFFYCLCFSTHLFAAGSSLSPLAAAVSQFGTFTSKKIPKEITLGASTSGSSALLAPPTFYELEVSQNSIVPINTTHTITLHSVPGVDLVQTTDITMWVRFATAVDCQVHCLPWEYDLTQFVPIQLNSSTVSYFVDSGFLDSSASYFFTAVPKNPTPANHFIGFTEIYSAYYVKSNTIVLPSNPIAFVTQTPIRQAFKGITTLVANHHGGDNNYWPIRGGDLWIAYPSGVKKNITQLAGFGQSGITSPGGNPGFQGPNGIAVRDPHVHWDGKKIIFSMIVGDNIGYFNGGQGPNYFWQLYEANQIGETETPIITRVLGQPENYNNTMPMYAPNDEIIFASDKVKAGKEHLYPYLDEYEQELTNAGIFKLTRSRKIIQLDDSPSGVINGIVDSFGRVLYIRWDHLNREEDAVAPNSTARVFQNESSTDYSAALPAITPGVEWFPEPPNNDFPDFGVPPWSLGRHLMNRFIIWQINPNGTELETLNHYGRHEFSTISVTSEFPALMPHDSTNLPQSVQHPIELFAHISEDPTEPGTYLSINGPEFETHAAGEIIKIKSPPGQPANLIQITALTNPETARYAYSGVCPVGHTGFYRNPIRLVNGSYVASHSPGCRPESTGDIDFRIKFLNFSGPYLQAGTSLTNGIVESVSYFPEGFSEVSIRNVTMWELQPVEVKKRSRPNLLQSTLPNIEKIILGNNEYRLRDWLKSNSLALIVSRNVTSRDSADKQQAYNLRVKNSTTQTLAPGFVGTPTSVEYLQIIQGDRTKGYSSVANSGRRIHPVPLKFPAAINNNIPAPGAPAGSVKIASDGSFAAFVPAQKALTWQLTDGSTPVVRERMWLTFQPGEIRVCTSCHGVNSTDQAGRGAPQNPPQALQDLLNHWLATH